MAGVTGEQDWYISGVFSMSFINLNDTFGDYIDRAGTVPKVNAAEDALIPSDAEIDAHAVRHKDGGPDELDVAELSGAKGLDGQVPITDGAAVTWVSLVHQNLLNVNTDDHHAKYTDSEAILAINNDADHGSTAQHNYASSPSDVGLVNVPNEDATDMVNWDQKGAIAGQAPKWTGSAWDPGDVFPSGGIILWSGSIANIPSGWALCDGNNGTPNLQDRFVIAAGNNYGVGSIGGGSIPSHSHGSGTLSTGSAGRHRHHFTMNDGGETLYDIVDKVNSNSRVQYTSYSGTHAHGISGSTANYGLGSEVIAKYYALAYIMKL